MAITDPVQLGELPCTCGRIARKPHCPSCGSYDVYGRASKRDVIKIDPTDGSPRRVSTFQCKRCRIFFDRDQMEMECHAPQYTTREIQKREQAALEKPIVAAQIEKTVTDPHTLAVMNKLRAARGMPPVDNLEVPDQYKDGQ